MPPAIIGKPTTSNAYRARDVRADIKELGFEKGIERAATLMADEQVGVRQSLSELSSIVSTLIDRLLEMGQVNEALTRQIDALKTRDDKYEATKEH